MKHTSVLLTALLALFLVTGSAACTGTITDEGLAAADPSGGGGGGTPPTPEEEAEKAICVGDGAAGGVCEVTADCDSPMVCLGGTCVGPQDPAYTCDPLEGIGCMMAGESCVNGMCVATPGACTTLDECPNGYTCSAGQCTPVRDGIACSDPSTGPPLAGTYKTTSVLHLRDALPGVVVGLFNASEEARNIISGNLDLGLPSLVEALIGGLVAGIVRSYVPAYALDIVNALATMGDILDTLGVEGTLTLDGQACDGNYRGRHKWDYVTYQMNGVPMRVKPNDLPGVDNVVPEDFSARYYCGDLLIDRHLIRNTMDKLVRWMLDTAAQAIANKPTIEQAIASLVDCGAVGNAVGNAASSALPFGAGAVGGIATAACTGFVSVATAKIGVAINQAAVKMALIKLRAIVPVNSDGTMGAGVWYGSLVGGDFLGTLQAVKQ